MNIMEILPNAEFEIMKVVWANEPPITTNIIMEQLGKKKKWKPQTIITLLSRLTKRGFIKTEKDGKILKYFPLVPKEKYIKFETDDFMKRFHENSFVSLINTLYDNKTLKDSDFDKLIELLEEKRD
ncbi:MAG TPA: BlaI/MecI/CopY family transcriptional regulator [Clostridia bacterium]|nr:BlaI/MecI/CopY family transcriptional regulator [Clostridia bacterium]